MLLCGEREFKYFNSIPTQDISNSVPLVNSDNDDDKSSAGSLLKHLPLTLFAMGEHILPAADSFVCCGSIRDLEKVKFSKNF